MRSKVLIIVSIIASIVVVIAALSLFGIFQENISAEKIIDNFVDSASKIETYKYKVKGTVTRTSDGDFDHGIGDPYIMYGQVDIVNKAYNGWINGNYINETLEKEKYELSYYVENNTYFYSRDNITWDCISHNYNPGNNIQLGGYSDNDYSKHWYSLSHLERLATNVIRNASFERLEDDYLDGVECFIIIVNPETNNLSLSGWGTGDLLFPYTYSNRSYMDEFSDEYEIEIKYWIDKENYLLKKAIIKADYNYEYTSQLNKSKPPISYKFSYNHENEIIFYDYNIPLLIEQPWQHYIDRAKEELSKLDLIDLEYGYGFNPANEWSNTNLTNFIVGFSNSSYGNYDWFIADRIEQLTSDSMTHNFTLTHDNITLNNMDGYEFIYQNIEAGSIVHEMYVKHQDRWLNIMINGEIDEYNSQIANIKQSLNSSLVIVTPYYQIIN